MNRNSFACEMCALALGISLTHEWLEAVHTTNPTESTIIGFHNQLQTEHDHKQHWESPPRELPTGVGSNQAPSSVGGPPHWRYSFMFFDDEPRCKV